MQTQCNPDRFGFTPVDGRAVVAALDGGQMTSDAGVVLLAATDRALGMVEGFAGCFADSRAPKLIEHTVRTLVGQRVFGIALSPEEAVPQRLYEDIYCARGDMENRIKGKPHQGVSARPVQRPRPCSGQGQACMGQSLSSPRVVDLLPAAVGQAEAVG